MIIWWLRLTELNNKAIIENVYKPIQFNSNKIQILTYNTL